MKRDTFGIAALQFLPVQALQQTAHKISSEFLFAYSPVLDIFYVDNCLYGADAPEQA